MDIFVFHFLANLQSFLKNRSRENSPNLFYETNTALIPKPEKDIAREVYYRPIFLMDLHIKILNKN